MINAGTNAAPNGITAQQSYMTFTWQTIQNGRVSSFPSCVPTSTLTTDISVMDSALQNEICDGPAQCNFRGTIVDPGSFAFASGALTTCPNGCPDPGQPPPQDQPIFRIGQVGICTVATGQANMWWQFDIDQPCSTGAPPTRDTEIILLSGDPAQNCHLFTTYSFSITGPTSTPSPTPTGGAATPTPSPTPSPTTAPPTVTRTFTPTLTPTSVPPTATRTN